MKAEIKKAQWWYCPVCGNENYGRILMLEGHDDKKEKIAKELGTSSDKLEYCMLPIKVKCDYCNKEFETIDGDSKDSFDHDLSNWN